MNFYKHHLSDYAKDTAHLSILEHGAYLLMLHHYYATEAPLPADQSVICRIIRATSKAEVAAVAEMLRQFWTLTPDGWVNGRATDEIDQAAAQRETNRELGKRGGRPKKTESVSESVSESKPKGKPNRNPSQTPDSRLKTVLGDNPPNPPAAAPPSVDLPPGLLPATWLAFRDHRQRLRAPLTPHAEQLLLAKLVRLGLDGHDPNAVVEQSIERGWKGFFPLNGSGHAADGINEWLHRTNAIEGEYTHDA